MRVVCVYQDRVPALVRLSPSGVWAVHTKSVAAKDVVGAGVAVLTASGAGVSQAPSGGGAQLP